jgi:uncharacterized CHY-type Zn-finger protein
LTACVCGGWFEDDGDRYYPCTGCGAPTPSHARRDWAEVEYEDREYVEFVAATERQQEAAWLVAEEERKYGIYYPYLPSLMVKSKAEQVGVFQQKVRHRYIVCVNCGGDIPNDRWVELGARNYCSTRCEEIGEAGPNGL